MEPLSKCEVCGNTALRPVLDLGPHPMCDDLVPIGDSRVCKEYPIEILFCDECITAHQRFQVPKQELFPQTYHYRARMTQSVLNFMSGLVDECERRYGSLADKLVLDVGCNDGSLLSFFRAKGARTIGVDPTSAAADAKAAGHDVVHGFFDEKIAAQILASHGKPDFITFTNVFAHIEDLPGLIRALRLLIGDHTRVVIENHYMGAVLDGNQFDTFYHEHPRTYSQRSFEVISKSLGLRLEYVEFPKRYGGNIRVWMSKGGASDVAPKEDEKEFGARFVEMAGKVEAWRASTRQMLADHVAAHGPIRAKAFPGRAAILIKLLGVDVDTISAVYEIKGSIKTGNYVPGTRIPILPEAELYQLDKTKPILNLAWHLPADVRANLAKNGYTGEVIDVMKADGL